MALRDRLRKLERKSEGPFVTIPQQDGSVKRFPERDQAPAFLDAFDRSLGRSDPHQPEHPLCAAARNSSDSRWQESVYVSSEAGAEPVEDLSE